MKIPEVWECPECGRLFDSESVCLPSGTPTVLRQRGGEVVSANLSRNRGRGHWRRPEVGNLAVNLDTLQVYERAGKDWIERDECASCGHPRGWHSSVGPCEAPDDSTGESCVCGEFVRRALSGEEGP